MPRKSGVSSRFRGYCLLPLLALGLGAAPMPTCAQEAPVALKSSGFEEGAADWKLPPTFTIVEDTARTGKCSLRVVNTAKEVYHLATQSFPFEAGMRYRFSAWIKTEGVQGEESGATVCVQWEGAKGWMGGTYPSGKKGNNDWYRVEGMTPPIPAEATSVGITLYLRKGMTGTAWFDDVEVHPAPLPALDAALLRPNYRGRLLSNAALQDVVARATVSRSLRGAKPEQTTLHAAILQGDRVVRQVRQAVAAPGDHDLRLDGANLAPGEYRVRVTLLGPGNTKLGEREFPLSKLDARAPQPAVTIDEHNRTLVNGKPFFPLGWYFGPGPSSKGYQEHLDRVASSPFNTIMCYGINSGGLEGVRAYLDALNSRGLKIIYSIKDVYEGTQYYQARVLGFQGEDQIVEGVVGAFKNHPAVLGWYLNDELPLAMRDRLEARNQTVRRLDPDHPTWAVLYQVDELAGYLGTADVLGTDPYPVPGKPVTLAADWTRKSAAASGGMRPLWMVPQAFDWDCYRKEGKHRAPTRGEVMVMSYLCLIHGANGLVYYSYMDLQRDRLGFDNRWADMLVVGSEMKQLFPALLSTAPAPKLTVQADSEAVQFSQRADDGGGQYVLLANPDAAKAARVRVTAPAAAEALLLRDAEMRPLARVKAGEVVTVALEPMSAATLLLKPRKP